MGNMKYLFSLLAAFLLCQCGAWAQGNTYVDDYYCGFDTQEEFGEWTVETKVGAAAWTWQSGGYVEFNTANDMFNDHDAWMFSPKITISNPENLCIRVLLHTSPSSEKLKITMGTEPASSAQATVVHDFAGFATSGKLVYYVFNLPEGTQPGDYYFGFQCYNAMLMDGNYMYVRSFEVTGNVVSDLSGTVTDTDSNPVAGTTVTLEGERYEAVTTTTDDAGKYAFAELSAGTYSVKAEMANYDPAEGTVEIEAGVDAVKDLTMAYMPRASVKGRVFDSMNRAVEGAEVTLHADQTYMTETDGNGDFLIEGILCREAPYEITILKDLKKTYTEEITVAEDLPESTLDLGEITLETNVMSPKNIQADILQDGALVTWMMPLREQELRYDNGSYYGRISVQGENTAVGVRFAQPVILNAMKWVLTSDYAASTVGVRVYALDENGNITDEILHEASGVPTLKYDYDGNLQWSEYLFEEPIEADNGCLVAIVGANLSVARDSGADPAYPYSCQYYTNNDYLTWDFDLPNLGGNLLLRGEGYVLGVPQNAARSQVMAFRGAALRAPENATVEGVSYDLWRMTEEEYEASLEGDAEAGTLLGEDLAEAMYYDRDFKSLPAGDYYYALKANFYDDNVSDYGYSSLVENKMRTRVDFVVSTSAGFGLTEGALVTLRNQSEPEYVYTGSIDADGALSISDIRKGIYALSIEKKGFETVNVELDLSQDDVYEASYSMTLIPEAPVNLRAVQDGSVVRLTWNTADAIEEDFEGMPDFAVDCAGDLGWSYIDGDGAITGTFPEIAFENEGAMMAYIVFNPSKTTPSSFQYVRPHSGNKVLAAIGAEAEANDDYLFSPELAYEDDFTFSFYAMSGYSGMLGNAAFMAGYTTGDVATEGITWFTEEAQEVGGLWTKFSYTVPKEAKHVVLRHVTAGGFMFLVDDIFIGYETTLAQELAAFEVSVDEEVAGMTSTNSYELSGLSAGDHIATVTAVYTNIDGTSQYSDEAEIIFTVEAVDAIDAVGDGIISFVYDANNGRIEASGAESIDVFDAQGRHVAGYENQETLSTGSWNAGIYIIRVMTGNKAVCHKILVR